MSPRTQSRHRRSRVALVGCVAAAAVFTGTSHANASDPDDDAVTFAFIGDVPYTSAQTPLMPSLTAAINADADVQFVAHSGDFKGGSDSCSDTAFQATFNQFQAFSDPFWYTPGDNDWTDCHRNSNGNFDPYDRLAKVRALYFSTPGKTTGGRTMSVRTQARSSVKADRVYVENTYFQKECVTFGAVHSVSSANGRLDPNFASTGGSGSSGYKPLQTPTERSAEKTARLAEVEARIAADVRWIHRIFAAAEEEDSGGVFLMMQAEPLVLAVPDNDKVFGDEFVAIRAAVFAEADAHPDMQVVIAHGDQHIHLWEPNYGGALHPNVARLENWGSNTAGTLAVTRWEKVTATCGEDGTRAVFTVADQAVPTV